MKTVTLPLSQFRRRLNTIRKQFRSKQITLLTVTVNEQPKFFCVSNLDKHRQAFDLLKGIKIQTSISGEQSLLSHFNEEYL